jgi:biopolymer transport protein ExbB
MMHVLLICSIGTIAIVVYCAVQITPKKMVPKNVVDSINRTMQQRDIHNAYALCEENPNSFSRVVSAALLKVNFDRDLANKASMEQAAVETIDQEETRQMLWVNYLNVFATLAPMIGLLGTVWGMIESFDQLARGASEPQDLAGGIGKAMLTTAGGLLVGIPAMFFYFFFRNRLVAIVSEIQKNATFAVDVLSGELKLAGGEEEGKGEGEE